MSKAKQRRQSAFSSGRKDALMKRMFRWKKHPQITDYRRGYTQGTKERREAEWAKYVQGKNGHDEL